MSADKNLVPSLGRRVFPSPLTRTTFVGEDAAVLRDVELPPRIMADAPPSFELAGPRSLLYFDPRTACAGIVTAGGVCPGINDVLRAIVHELRHGYGVGPIIGFRYGVAGIRPGATHPPISLDPESVRNVHTTGGTFLGTARGPSDPEEIATGLVGRAIDVLFAIGGDGTMRAAHAISKELQRRGSPVAVVGVPKTIDNDIPFVDKTFGFDTAVATARLALEAAHAEATSVHRGVALVKLMGRQAGFIAAQASLASHEVNACLVPEVPFELDGKRGFLAWLGERLDTRGHAVVVVAEGCTILGRHAAENDASGNERLSADDRDIGRHLKRAIEDHFVKLQRPITLKYIDPSYIVRALRPTAEDAVFCDALGRNAVHAAMAGKTDMVVGRWHRRFTHVALADVLAHTKRLDPAGDTWAHVLESTGQPSFVNDGTTTRRCA